jgi:hypothetical protein
LANDGLGEVVGPSGAFAFSADRELRAGGSQNVEGEPAEDGEVLGAGVGAVAGAVLVEGDVEDPIEAVFDGPVGADGLSERSVVRRAEER